MAKPYEVSLVGNVRSLVSAMGDGADSVKEITEALDGAEQAAEQSADQIGRNLEDGFEKAEDGAKEFKKVSDRTWEELDDDVKAADRTVDTLEDSFRQAAKAGRDIGDDVDAATKKGSEGLDDMKSEALSTAKESAASFSSIEDVADSLQEVLANAFVSFGPAGAAAGLAAALGLGLAIAAGEASAEAINDAKEKTGELALAIVDAGGDIRKVDIAAIMRDWGVEIADNKDWWEFWQDGAVSNLDKARKAAEETGSDFTTMFRAMSGQDPKAAVEAIKSLDEQIEKNWDRIRALQAEDAIGTIFQANGIEQSTKALEANRAEIELASGGRKQAIQDAKDYAEATERETSAAELLATQEEKVQGAMDARTAATDTLIAEVDEAVGAFQTYQDKETGVFDAAAYVEGMRQRNEATANFGTNVLGIADKFKLTQEETQALLDQGIDFAGPLDSIINSGMDDEFIAQWRAGRTGAEKVIKSGDYNASGVVTVRVDRAEADRQLADLLRSRTLNVTPRISGVNSYGGLVI